MSINIDQLHSTSIELWIDDAKKMVLNEGYFRELSELGIDALSVMIDRSDREPELTWDVKDVEKLLELADPYAMEIILTIWPYPDQEQLRDLFEKVSVYFAELRPLSALEVDTEFNWKPSLVRGFRDRKVNGVWRTALDLAGDSLVDLMDETVTNGGLWNPGEIRKELTTFTSHTENGRAADVAPHMDRLKVQAYSTRTRPTGRKDAQGKPILFMVPWDHTYGPGHMQKFTLDRTMMIPEVADPNRVLEVGVGMAMWDQKWPGHSPDEAMNKAFEAAMVYKPVCLSGWSSKHVIGKMRNGFAYSFLHSLQEMERERGLWPGDV